MYKLKRKDKEIDEQLNRAAAWEDAGATDRPNSTYESGVKAGIEWMLGDLAEAPIYNVPDDDGDDGEDDDEGD